MFGRKVGKTDQNIDHSIDPPAIVMDRLWPLCIGHSVVRFHVVELEEEKKFRLVVGVRGPMLKNSKGQFQGDI
jgi:hypothetical protein